MVTGCVPVFVIVGLFFVVASLSPRIAVFLPCSIEMPSDRASREMLFIS